jgi:flavin reductase (DIM6/NTAB) family NADH-FMN oxidoreductase RutF
LALSFALGSGRDRDKLAGLALQDPIATGDRQSQPPVLADCLAWLACRVYARMASGDRIYFWADVVAGNVLGREQPLGEQALMAAASAEQRQLLRENLAEDQALLRPLQEQWRAHLPDWLKLQL